MKLLIVTIITAIFATGQAFAIDYRLTEAKADRFFDNREWASAQALYGLMLEQEPGVAATYSHAIVASAMMGDTVSTSDLLSQAMSHGVKVDSLFEAVRTTAFEVSAPSVYESFMLTAQRDCPWLARAIDGQLLDYYLFRDNGEKIVVFANKMLAGLPESTYFLGCLARGHALQGDFETAVAVWKRILRIDPDHYDTLLNLGNYLIISGDQSNAQTYLERADKIKPTPYVTERLASLR